jgi:hypothetical protein
MRGLASSDQVRRRKKRLEKRKNVGTSDYEVRK